MDLELEFVSLTVKDMDRAVEFYNQILGIEPEKYTERLSLYDLGNIRISLWNASIDNVQIEFGDNCVPTFQSENLEEDRKRIRRISDEVEEITDNGDYRLFHFRDPEGNLIEVYEGEK